MKIFLRNAALALSVLSLGAAIANPDSSKMPSTKKAGMIPVPMCPVSSPDGCGIYQ